MTVSTRFVDTGTVRRLLVVPSAGNRDALSSERSSLPPVCWKDSMVLYVGVGTAPYEPLPRTRAQAYNPPHRLPLLRAGHAQAHQFRSNFTVALRGCRGGISPPPAGLQAASSSVARWTAVSSNQKWWFFPPLSLISHDFFNIYCVDAGHWQNTMWGPCALCRCRSHHEFTKKISLRCTSCAFRCTWAPKGPLVLHNTTKSWRPFKW